MQKNREQQEQKWINGIRLFGSKKDADQLVRSYYDEIYIFVFRQINDAEKALDLTQDIFISMLQSIPAYKKQMASFRTWLYRIATNKVIDYRKKYVPIAEEIFYILKGEKEFDEELYSRKVYSLLDSDSFETDSEKFFDDFEVHHMEPIVKDKRIYPNDPCPCGSGKKYKKCCGR